MSLKKKIIYSIDLGLFLTGVLIIALCINGKTVAGYRGFLGECSILLSYSFFPFIDHHKKDKIFSTIAVHMLLLIIAFFITFFTLGVYIKNPVGAVWWKELLAYIGLLYVVSYIMYIFINFARSFYALSSKLFSFLFGTNMKENYSSAKKTIENITSFIATITALVASVIALFASFKNIMGS